VSVGRLQQLAFALVLLAPTTLWALPPEQTFKERTLAQLGDRDVSDWGHIALRINPQHWKHGETDHFIIHYFRSGDGIARRSEAFYTEIKEFFGNRPDLLRGRKSHVFAFNEAKDWDEFRQAIGGMRILGITHGNEFFYLATGASGQFDSKAKVQAHEMTHLIFNRFFESRPPLWLNEGIAEYFGQKKTSSIVEFRRRMGQTSRFELERLFEMETYPHSPEEIEAFYSESAIVVDFLTRTPDGAALLPKFVDVMIANDNMAEAVKLYGFRDITEFKAAYLRYRKWFQ
jgi:hypothetical protein